MRKITREAYNAFTARKRFTKSNTSVRIDNGEAKMYLFGNLIAKTDGADILICDGGYRASRTTKERLNAFPGVTLRTFRNEFILNEQMKWDGKWFKIN
jgi:hypothetical protein